MEPLATDHLTKLADWQSRVLPAAGTAAAAGLAGAGLGAAGYELMHPGTDLMQVQPNLAHAADAHGMGFGNAVNSAADAVNSGASAVGQAMHVPPSLYQAGVAHGVIPPPDTAGQTDLGSAWGQPAQLGADRDAALARQDSVGEAGRLADWAKRDPEGYAASQARNGVPADRTDEAALLADWHARQPANMPR